jgi:hypothetical protein
VLSLFAGELTAHVKFTVLLKTDKLVKITPSPKYQKLLPLRSFDEPLLGMDENSAASKNGKTDLQIFAKSCTFYICT